MTESNERKAQRYAENREKICERNRAYYAANREEILAKKRAGYKSYGRKYEYDYERDRNRHLRSTYGISSTDFDLMVAQQNGGCAVCHETMGAEDLLHVDHDHETGLVRGLLCRKCNLALGYVNDDVDRLMALASYLLQSSNLLNVSPL